MLGNRFLYTLMHCIEDWRTKLMTLLFWLDLQELPECQRADAVASMVYEAGARIRDPVYGSAGAICQLQKQVNELQAQLAKAQAEVVNMQFQQANLVALICMEMSQTPQESPQQSVDNFITSPSHSSGYQNNLSFFEDNTNLNSLWEPLWTWLSWTRFILDIS